MEAAAYQQYLHEADDWLKTARARLLALLVARHRQQREPLELLEVGAGAGQNLPTLAQFGIVDAIEINALGREAIRAHAVARDVFAESVPFPLNRRYDVVCALDVIEHIDDDNGAVRWIADLLRPGGIFIATVPAYRWLFSDHDRALGHYRRYTRAQLAATLPTDMQVVTSAYFTHFAFPLAVVARGSWSLRRRIGRSDAPIKQASPRGGIATRILTQLHAFELTLISRGYRPPFGLSAYVVARRRGSNGT